MSNKKVTTKTEEIRDEAGKLIKTITTTVTEEIVASGKKTYAIFVLDSSSSMLSGVSSTITQFNASLDLLNNKRDELGEVNVSLIKFADQPTFVFTGSAPGSAQRLASYNYAPYGNTALNDAIGMAINYAKDTFNDLDKPDVAVLINIFTDGEENVSKKFSTQDIKRMVTAAEKTGKWTFTTVAPEKSKMAFINDYGFQTGNFFGYNPNDLESRSKALMSNTSSLTNYASIRSFGGTASANTFTVQTPAPGVKIDLTVNNNEKSNA